MNNIKNFSLSEQDWKDLGQTAKAYLIPLLGVYLTSISPVVATIQAPGYVFKIADFGFNAFFIGGVVTYLFNRLYGFTQKGLAPS